MKVLPLSLAFLGGLLSSRGEEAAPLWDVEIPAPISDSRPSEPAPEVEPINFKVQSSQTTRVAVTEAPPMPGLPPVKGTINVTVQWVKDPGLPDPSPLPALPPEDPAVIARMEELRKNDRGMTIVFLSATVYDHSRTLLRIYPNGNAEGEITAWSNVDFNYFCGVSTFRIKESNGTSHDCQLLMGIGNSDTRLTRKRIAGNAFAGPKIPDLPDLASGGPAFVVTGGPKDGEAMNTLAAVHDLYRMEGAKMEAAFQAREKAQEERRAYLLANPPVPKDIVIRFWKRDQPVPKQP